MLRKIRGKKADVGTTIWIIIGLILALIVLGIMGYYVVYKMILKQGVQEGAEPALIKAIGGAKKSIERLFGLGGDKTEGGAAPGETPGSGSGEIKSISYGQISKMDRGVDYTIIGTDYNLQFYTNTNTDYSFRLYRNEDLQNCKILLGREWIVPFKSCFTCCESNPNICGVLEGIDADGSYVNFKLCYPYSCGTTKCS